jgi:hypothetical protein
MEPGSFLQCSQEPATSPYPEPEASIHTFLSCFPKIHTYIIYYNNNNNNNNNNTGFLQTNFTIIHFLD